MTLDEEEEKDHMYTTTWNIFLVILWKQNSKSEQWPAGKKNSLLIL